MSLSDLPHGSLILGCDQLRAIWVFEEFILVNLCHASNFWILPLRWIFLTEEYPLLLRESSLHLLMLFVKGHQIACESSDALTLTGIVLEELGLLVHDLGRLLGHLMSPLGKDFSSRLVEETSLLVSLTLGSARVLQFVRSLMERTKGIPDVFSSLSSHAHISS